MVVAATATTPVITWNVADGVGIPSSTITVDGRTYGLRSVWHSSNANYAGVLGTLTSGSHSYTITATDASGLSATSDGTFTTAAAKSAAVAATVSNSANGSAKSDWLIDCSTATNSWEKTFNATDAVFSGY